MKKKSLEVHILIGCADARDLTQVQLDCLKNQIQRYNERGIDIDFHALRVAGSFVSPDVIMDIKRTIEKVQRESAQDYSTVDFYIHIQTHGHLDDHSRKDYIIEIYEMDVVKDSSLNCGMLNATQVGVEIEKMLIEERLEVYTHRGRFVIKDSQGILRLLKEVYAFEGYLAGDWIKSIDYLRTHSRAQRALLEKHIHSDPELNALDIKVTAGILDYARHSLIRLDGGDPPVPFWDTYQKEVRLKSTELTDNMIQQAKKQKPQAGLICMSDPSTTSRTIAARYYMNSKGIEYSEYLPNLLFNMSGGGFDLPSSPFGPYTIAGFFYAVRYLGLKDQMIMGADADQTKRMIKKIKNDPIMNLIVQKFDVNLIPINQNSIIESSIMEEIGEKKL